MHLMVPLLQGLDLGAVQLNQGTRLNRLQDPMHSTGFPLAGNFAFIAVRYP
jgi:hypothetical protein